MLGSYSTYFATAFSAALSLRVKIRQNPQIPNGIKTASTMAEVMPALWALYLAWAVMKKNLASKWELLFMFCQQTVARKPPSFYKNSFYTV